VAKQQALKLVESDPLEGYEPLLLSSVEMLDAYWLSAEPHVRKCVDKAMHGELTTEDVYEAVKAGQMYLIVLRNDAGELPDVALALALELITYPRYTVMNVVALGGRDLRHFQTKFWKHVCSWAYMNGVRKMQASASPAMARILSKFGFKDVYTTMRMDLTEI
jgi:hypothetical protein